MVYNFTFTLFLFIFFVCSACEAVAATLIIHSHTAVNIELIGYDGLAEKSIFKGKVAAGGKHEVDTGYRGLALLIFDNRASYPLIIGDTPFDLKIVDSAGSPSFTDSAENDSLYRALSGNDPVPEQYQFALLMIQAKQLLESSHSLGSIKELNNKKKEFERFITDHYQRLQHSDMARRLIEQYFMMHEYVSYHSKEATEIRVTHKQAVLNGVGAWLATLKPYIPEHEILNYCVSLYYNRSMVTLASLIVDNFPDAAFCPGIKKEKFNFPDDLTLVAADGNRAGKLSEFKSNKIIAFVSDDCPVSMVATVIKARQSAEQKAQTLVIAPLQQLSNKYLTMNRMVSGGDMVFVNDEQWRKDNLTERIKLPLFVEIGEGFD